MLATELLNERASFFYEVEVPDTQGSRAVADLIASGVSAVMGSLPRALAAPFDDAGLPLLVLDQDDALETVGPTVFRLAMTDIEVLREATDGLRVLQEWDSFGVLTSSNIPPRFVGKSFPGKAFVTSQAGVATSQEVDAIVVVTPEGSAEKTLDDLAATGYEGAVVAGPSASDAIAEAGFDGDVFLTDAWAPESPLPLSEEFVVTYEQRFDEEPSRAAAAAYSGVILIARAVEEACSNEPTDIVKELPETRHATTLLGRFSFGKDRTPRHPVMVFEVRGDEERPIGLTPGPD